MVGTLTELSVAGQLALSALGKRFSGGIEAEPDRAGFRAACEAAVAALPDGLVAEHTMIDLDATEVPWHDTGIALAPGEAVSLFMVGRIVVSKPLDIWLEPLLNVWAKIGADDDVSRGTQNTRTIEADRAGPLLLGNFFPNDWKDPKGNFLQDPKVYAQVSGGTMILAVKWSGAPEAGVAALVDAGDPAGLASAELERLKNPPRLPEGWTPIFNIGNSNIFRGCEGPGGAPAMCAHFHKDVSIIHKETPLPFGPGTTLSWKWNVETLASPRREDAIPSHDYVSIAVEFDNGIDLTYFWSRSIPVGTGFWCPLPNWKHREYHVVARSGTAELGQWLSEEKDLYADYKSHIGDAPGRIVKVWFIANAIFQRGTGKAAFSDITLTSGGETLKVL